MEQKFRTHYLNGDQVTRTATGKILNVVKGAQIRGEENVKFVAERVDANELERETIAKFERLIRHGVASIDIKVRADGRDYQFEGDWIARLFRLGGFER